MAKADKETDVSAKKTKRLKMEIKKAHLIIVALILIMVGGGYFGYHKYDQVNQEKQRLADPQEAARQETQRVKDQVAKLIDVPQGEDPTIASVVDASKLSNQAFFKNAQNNDKVLMYSQAKKAILYRPSTNKIIEVAPINIGDNSQNKTPAATPPAQ